MLAELPPPYGRVLDVGCGAGATGRSLRAGGGRADGRSGAESGSSRCPRGRSTTWSTRRPSRSSLDSGASMEPSTRSCSTTCSSTSSTPPRCCAALRRVAAPGARVHISVPNARHWTLMRDLVVRGTFGYTEWGHRDATHLRWFTRTGHRARSCPTPATASSCSDSQRVRSRARSWTGSRRGRCGELLALQWHVLARHDRPRQRSPSGRGGARPPRQRVGPAPARAAAGRVRRLACW